jgi:hypothetical protein
VKKEDVKRDDRGEDVWETLPMKISAGTIKVNQLISE